MRLTIVKDFERILEPLFHYLDEILEFLSVERIWLLVMTLTLDFLGPWKNEFTVLSGQDTRTCFRSGGIEKGVPRPALHRTSVS